MSAQKVVIGLFAGLAAGAIMGILFAPAKGSDTRKKIAKKSSEAVSDVKSRISDLMDEVAEKFEEEKEEITEAYTKAKEKNEKLTKESKAV